MGQTTSTSLPNQSDTFCKEISHIIEILPNRLYFATVLKKTSRIRSTPRVDYFCIDNELVYEGFNKDFGPLNLAMLYRYCSILKGKLKKPTRKIVHYTSPNRKKRANAGFLIGSYAVLYLNKTPEEIYKCLTKSTPKSPPFASFRDVANGPPSFLLSLLDLFNAVEKAFFYNFFNFKDFDFKEYEFHQQCKNLSWIVPDKLLAFIGPHPSFIKNGHPAHSPEDYHSYFKKHNVTAVVRLNRKLYKASRFTDAGFEHYELYFDDGTPPTDEILTEFLRICDLSSGALAVHCEAGIGRTGTLIAAFIMKNYKFTAREAIAWLRICRPGSVMNNQQQWLEKKEDWLWGLETPEEFKGDPNLTSQNIENLRWPLHSLKKNACMSWIEQLATTNDLSEAEAEHDMRIIDSDSDEYSNAKIVVSESDNSDEISEKLSMQNVYDLNENIENKFYNYDETNRPSELNAHEFGNFSAKNKKSDNEFYPLKVPHRRPTFLYCGKISTRTKPKKIEVKPTYSFKSSVERIAFDSYPIHTPDLYISAFSRVRPFRITLRDVHSKPILFLERSSLDCATLLPGFCRLFGLRTGKIKISLTNGSRVGEISHRYKYFKSVYYLTDVNGLHSLSVSDSQKPSNTHAFLEYPVINEKTGKAIGCFRKDFQSRDYKSVEGRPLQNFIVEVPLDLDSNLKSLFSAASFVIEFLFPGRLESSTET